MTKRGNLRIGMDWNRRVACYAGKPKERSHQRAWSTAKQREENEGGSFQKKKQGRGSDSWFDHLEVKCVALRAQLVIPARGHVQRPEPISEP